MRGKKISREVLEYIRVLTLMDNNFMNMVLEGDISCVEEMLSIILNKDNLNVISAHTQKMLQGFKRSVYLDVYAEDSQNTRYNIEIQRTDDGADFRRARFHGSMIDSHSLNAGQKFSELPECYVIFITQNDVIGYNKAIYTVHRYIDGDMQPFEDGSHIIYINASAKDDGTQLWKLIHDLQCADPEKMFLPRLRARVSFFKNKEEGTVEMSSAAEELFEKIVEKRVERRVKKAEKQIEKQAAKQAAQQVKEIEKHLAQQVKEQVAQQFEKQVKEFEKQAVQQVKEIEKQAAQQVAQQKESIALNLIKLGQLSLESIAASVELTIDRVMKLAASVQASGD